MGIGQAAMQRRGLGKYLEFRFRDFIANRKGILIKNTTHLHKYVCPETQVFLLHAGLVAKENVQYFPVIFTQYSEAL